MAPRHLSPLSPPTAGIPGRELAPPASLGDSEDGYAALVSQRGNDRSRRFRTATYLVVGTITIADYFIARLINHDGKTFDAATVLNLVLLLVVSCSIGAGILWRLRPH